MNRVAAAVGSPSGNATGRVPLLLSEAWGRFTTRHYIYTLGLCLAIGIPRGISLWANSAATAKALPIIAAACLEAMLVGISLLLAIGIGDRVSDRRGFKWTPYLIAGLAAPALGVAVARGVWSAYTLCGCGPRPYVVDIAIGYAGWMLLTTFASLAYAYARRVRQRDAALRAAQVERERLQRNAIESRLQAMQARVEPQFLFNTLAQVERLYETDTPRADRMLDDLITYLRAALPHLRDTTSTLAKELDLARAYLDIMKLRLGDRFSFDVETPDGADDVRIPPMMLLPLIDHAVVHPGSDHAYGTLLIAASIDTERLRLVVADSNGRFADGEGVEAIHALRERLTTLYGSEATLVLDGDAQRRGTRCVIEVPYERTHSPDR